MKIQKKEASKVFQPITLEITIESEDELKIMQKFFERDDTVSRHAYEEDWIDTTEQQRILCSILNNIYKCL